MAANNYFEFIDWKQAVDIAKCCIAKKQASQVGREANLMGRCSDTDAEIQFLQSSLYLLNNYTYEGDFNQITDAECLELIQRINVMCNCDNEEPYSVPDICNITEICVSGTYTQEGGDSVNLVAQTVNPDLNCNFVFTIEDPVNGELTYVIEKNGANWQLINTDFDVVSQITNANPSGNYTWSVDTVEYSLTVTLGACS